MECNGFHEHEECRDRLCEKSKKSIVIEVDCSHCGTQHKKKMKFSMYTFKKLMAEHKGMSENDYDDEDY